MSTNRHALVHEVIPYMDILTEHLARFKDDHVLHPVVCAASEQGIEVINQYYSKTDQSVIYRIAMSGSCHLASIPASELTASIPSPPPCVQDAVLHRARLVARLD